jgi:hypothetical protein
MKSPFPGMDPYIEACRLWGDFHNRLICKIGECLADTLPERYLVRAGERTYIQGEGEHREAFVEIYEPTLGQGPVTRVEVLSPSNKCPNMPGWELYMRKRQSVLLEGVNLVEIDLLRGGQRMPMLDPWPDSPYTLLVAQAMKAHLCKVWPANFQRPLPLIPVPLAKPDPDVRLNLQPMIEAIYQRFRYDRSIDYTRPLTPPLASEDAAWLEAQLRRRAGPK